MFRNFPLNCVLHVPVKLAQGNKKKNNNNNRKTRGKKKGKKGRRIKIFVEFIVRNKFASVDFISSDYSLQPVNSCTCCFITKIFHHQLDTRINGRYLICG